MPNDNKKASITTDNLGSKFRGAAHFAGAYSGASSAMRAGGSPTTGLAKGVIKRAGPLMVAGAAIDTVALASSEKSRQAAKDGVEKDAKSSAPMRMAKGFISPVNTAYGIQAQAKEYNESAKASEKSLDSTVAAYRQRALKNHSDPDYKPSGKTRTARELEEANGPARSRFASSEYPLPKRQLMRTFKQESS